MPKIIKSEIVSYDILWCGNHFDLLTHKTSIRERKNQLCLKKSGGIKIDFFMCAHKKPAWVEGSDKHSKTRFKLLFAIFILKLSHVVLRTLAERKRGLNKIWRGRCNKHGGSRLKKRKWSSVVVDLSSCERLKWNDKQTRKKEKKLIS